MSNALRDASATARDAADSRPVELLARGGLIAYGVVHLLIGVIALQVAWGGTRTDADQSGALRTLAQQPFGSLLLWFVVVGLVALAVWQGSQAVWDTRGGDASKRARRRGGAAAKAGVYLLLALSAGRYAMGARSSSSAETQQSTTRQILGLPFGEVLVVIAAGVVVGVGAWQLRKAYRKSFLKEIDHSSASPGTIKAITRLGQAGYAAKGVALAIVGLLLGYAALAHDPAKAQGLDGAMHAIAVQPFGQLLLTAVAIGFAAFGIFTFAQSRYRSM